MKSFPGLKEALNDSTRYLTTGQVARICGISTKTVNRWTDQGFLSAVHLPGRGDRRIEVTELIRFMNKNGMRIPRGLSDRDSEKRILIVDNEQPVARAIARVLRKLNVEIKLAFDGFRAGYLLRAFQPHLVVLDLKMPGCDGFDVLETIKEYSKETKGSPKILVVSGAQTNDLERAIKAGANLALSKPYRNEELLEKSRSLVA